MNQSHQKPALEQRALITSSGLILKKSLPPEFGTWEKETLDTFLLDNISQEHEFTPAVEIWRLIKENATMLMEFHDAELAEQQRSNVKRSELPFVKGQWYSATDIETFAKSRSDRTLSSSGREIIGEHLLVIDSPNKTYSFLLVDSVKPDQAFECVAVL